MDPEDADAPSLESRPPTLADLVKMCRHLNAEGAKYLVVGGMAVIQHGYTRATEDVDFLVEDSPANQTKVYKAMECLPDKASENWAMRTCATTWSCAWRTRSSWT